GVDLRKDLPIAFLVTSAWHRGASLLRVSVVDLGKALIGALEEQLHQAWAAVAGLPDDEVADVAVRALGAVKDQGRVDVGLDPAGLTETAHGRHRALILRSRD